MPSGGRFRELTITVEAYDIGLQTVNNKVKITGLAFPEQQAYLLYAKTGQDFFSPPSRPGLQAVFSCGWPRERTGGKAR